MTRWATGGGLRPGATLPELILAAWLFTFVLAALAGFAGAQGRLAALMAERVRAAELGRVAQVVLGAELRSLSRSDLTVLPPDSVRIRAFRGGGPTCAGAGPGELLVAYRGVRRPEPDKDSVLLVHGRSTDGTAYRIVDVASARECDAGVRLTLDAHEPVPAGLALVFERGSYSVTAGALRYNRGAGGRQPLTEALLSGGVLEPRGASLRLRLRFHPDSLPRTVPDWPLSIQLRNRAIP